MRIVVDGLPYPIVIADTAPAEAANLVASECAQAIVVCDREVESRGELIAAALRRAGCDVLARRNVDAGERRKQWKSVAELHAAFLAARLDRGGLVVGVGGGTLTDVVGFAAATFMRGVRWLAIPTTIVGMVDAAIGGKTGVDRPEGKNLIGAIWQPVGVIADIAALATLPTVQRKSGMAEVIKTAIVGDPDLLTRALRHDLTSGPAAWADIVARAAAVKTRVVAADPGDRGVRASLNLGHTFAHGIESASKYRIAHGAAVALGLRAAGVLAREHTGWAHPDHRSMLRALRHAGLRLSLSNLSSDCILAAMRVDKKRRNGILRFVLPVRLGEVRAGVEPPESAVREALATIATTPQRDAW